MIALLLLVAIATAPPTRFRFAGGAVPGRLSERAG